VQGPARTEATGAVVPSGESAALGRKNRLQPVLRALLDAGGSLHVAELVRRHGSTPAVARASTSRTLRRLSRAGLVELFEKRGNRLDVPRRGYATRVAITAAGVEAVNSHCQ